MNKDSVNEWVGLRLEDGFTVVEFLGAGAHHVVFKIAKGTEEHVLKFRRGHIGFAIRLPPDRWFPSVADDSGYDAALLARLGSLQGSRTLSRLSPFEELWTALAVQHLPSPDPEWQSVSLKDYDMLASSSFVRERLVDWSAADVGRSDEELLDEIVIYEGDKPIYAEFPKLLARNAKETLDALDSRQENRAVADVVANPLLPWIGAILTGYSIPAPGAAAVARALSACDDISMILRQAGQAARHARSAASWQEQTDVIEFVMMVMAQAGPQQHLDRGLFLHEFAGAPRGG